MAYFIVIGTSNNVKEVVDGIKQSHLQHNVVTSGCIINNDQGMYYHWDVFNANGEKTNENNNNDPIELHDALTNQIAQFRLLLPANTTPHVFIVSTCLSETDSENLLMVYNELCQIGGTTFGGLQIDIVIVGYDLNSPNDVTIRPDWKRLKSLKGLGCNNPRFNTNILYINNMDYAGAATNIDSKVLSKFLCHWSKIKSSGNALIGVSQSTIYSIGMSEHQYDFRDLNDFFKLAAEEKLLDRTLNSEPSPATQTLIDKNYYKQIDLSLEWIDGLCRIQFLWDTYCTTEWKPSQPLDQQSYSVSRQEHKLAKYLNQYLKLYVLQEKSILSELCETLKQKQDELDILNQHLEENKGELEEPAGEQEDVRKSQLETEISKLCKRIEEHKENIKRNTFLDADDFYQKLGALQPVTEEDQKLYDDGLKEVERLIEYVKTEKGVKAIRTAIERSTAEELPSYSIPTSTIESVGWLNPQGLKTSEPNIQTPPVQNPPALEEQSNRVGCLAWFWELLYNRNEEGSKVPKVPQKQTPNTPIDSTTRNGIAQDINSSIAALKKIDDIRQWWSNLCKKIEKSQVRKDECRLLMDGEKDLNGRYLPGKKGYNPRYHTKSESLIDMDLVRNFRDNNEYYQRMLDKFLGRWFDSTQEHRMTMPELIKHQILDPLVGQYHTLHWNGQNPFVKEILSDQELHDYITHDIKHSKPFVEYIQIQNQNITQNISTAFFSNNPNIPQQAPNFRTQYSLGHGSIIPTHISDFVNSLSVVQVMNIENHIDSLKDFKPKRTAILSRLQTDITSETLEVIKDATTIEDKAKAIYEWLCQNIAYDTTKQIHDAETCWRTKRGVCQAYCELFCYMADIAGFTADIIVGKTKTPKGEIPEEKHAWIFVYTEAYEGILIDPTWGAGAVNEKNQFIRSRENSMWFNISPYWLIFSHYPDEQEWTKLEGIDITQEQFEKLPYKQPTGNGEEGKDLLFESLANLSE